MHTEDAQAIRISLLRLEGLISPETRENIGKVLMGPCDQQEMRRFADSIDHTRPFPTAALEQLCKEDERYVYFLLMKNGKTRICRYEEFMYHNKISMEAMLPLRYRFFCNLPGI